MRTSCRGVFASGGAFWINAPSDDGRYRWRRFPLFEDAVAFQVARGLPTRRRNTRRQRRRTGRQLGWIYFVAPVGGGPIKIGFTVDLPARRLAELQCGSPVSLEILAYAQGTRTDEALLHYEFRRHRLHGEWFQPTPVLLAEIEDAKDRPPQYRERTSDLPPRRRRRRIAANRSQERNNG